MLFLRFASVKTLLGSFVFVLFCVVLTSLALSGCQRVASSSGNILADAKARGYLIIGVKYDSPPFGFMDADETLKGLEIELAKELTARLMGDPSKVKFVQVQTATRIPTLQAKQVDFVIATMTITPEREKIVRFSTPYFEAHQGIMVKSSSKIASVKDLTGNKTIFVIGGTGEKNLRTANPKAELLGFKSSTEAFSSFYAGRAEAFSTDDSILNGFLSKNCGVKLINAQLSVEKYGIAFRKDAESKALADKVDSLLKSAQDVGLIEQLKDEWIIDTPPASCP
jgi:aspartate/glutamate/glutamine transport system substrate-binding protein